MSVRGPVATVAGHCDSPLFERVSVAIHPLSLSPTFHPPHSSLLASFLVSLLSIPLHDIVFVPNHLYS